eukprot:TRINITY_DN7134_c0_g2_i2.p1 TRINITY_DN7134_c0_g2~~TRINITY_DN7134_c0_g2_i2.p1  ORF type:complete len:567 (+),score=136.73 TRINITY_DN7134_c0_g2_i2:34-1734(+)
MQKDIKPLRCFFRVSEAFNVETAPFEQIPQRSRSPSFISNLEASSSLFLQGGIKDFAIARSPASMLQDSKIVCGSADEREGKGNLEHIPEHDHFSKGDDRCHSLPSSKPPASARRVKTSHRSQAPTDDFIRMMSLTSSNRVVDRLIMQHQESKAQLENKRAMSLLCERASVKQKPKISKASEDIIKGKEVYQKYPNVVERMYMLEEMRMEKLKRMTDDAQTTKDVHRFSPQITRNGEMKRRTMQDLLAWQATRSQKINQLREEQECKKEEQELARKNRPVSYVCSGSEKILRKRRCATNIGSPVEQRLLQNGQRTDEKLKRIRNEESVKAKSAVPKINSNTEKILENHFKKVKEDETASRNLGLYYSGIEEMDYAPCPPENEFLEERLSSEQRKFIYQQRANLRKCSRSIRDRDSTQVFSVYSKDAGPPSHTERSKRSGHNFGESLHLGSMIQISELLKNYTDRDAAIDADDNVPSTLREMNFNGILSPAGSRPGFSKQTLLEKQTKVRKSDEKIKIFSEKKQNRKQKEDLKSSFELGTRKKNPSYKAIHGSKRQTIDTRQNIRLG